MADQKPADTKRVKISKAQQLTMVEVLGASLVLGTCLVLSIFLIKYINFNTKIITAKNEAIADYDQTLRNVGICADKDKNGRLDDTELEACNPNATEMSSVINSLKYNVFEAMAANTDLESVARRRNEDICYNEDGTRRNFTQEYNIATDDKGRQRALEGSKLCSALRVIPDALPAQKNTEALMASLNEIFIESNWEPEALSPRDDKIESGIDGVGVIPVTLRLEGGDATVLNVLNNIERSIREFSITSATIEWNSVGLSLNAQANAFYLEEIPAIETETTVRAKTGRATKASGQSLTSASSAASELRNQ